MQSRMLPKIFLLLAASALAILGLLYISSLSTEQRTPVSVDVKNGAEILPDAKSQHAKPATEMYRQRDEEVLLGFCKAPNKCGYINQYSDEIVPPEFETVSSVFSGNGLAAVQKNGLWGYIDTTGKMVISPQFESAGAFSDFGVARIRNVVESGPNYYQLIDISGKVIADNDYTEMSDFSANGLAKVCQNYSWREKCGFIDRNGAEIIPLAFYSVREFGANRLALVQTKQHGLWGYINALGEFELSAQYSKATEFSSDGEAVVRLEDSDQAVVIDENGDVIAEFPDFGWNVSFWYGKISDGLSTTWGNNGYGYLSNDGSLTIPHRYQDVWPFEAGIASVKLNDGWGTIGKDGKFIIEPMYRYKLNFKGRNWAVAHRKDGLTGLIDISGNPIIPFGRSSFTQIYQSYAEDIADQYLFVHFDEKMYPVSAEGSPIGITLSDILEYEDKIASEIEAKAQRALDALNASSNAVQRSPQGSEGHSSTQTFRFTCSFPCKTGGSSLSGGERPFSVSSSYQVQALTWMDGLNKATGIAGNDWQDTCQKQNGYATFLGDPECTLQ